MKASTRACSKVTTAETTAKTFGINKPTETIPRSNRISLTHADNTPRLQSRWNPCPSLGQNNCPRNVLKIVNKSRSEGWVDSGLQEFWKSWVFQRNVRWWTFAGPNLVNQLNIVSNSWLFSGNVRLLRDDKALSYRGVGDHVRCTCSIVILEALHSGFVYALMAFRWCKVKNEMQLQLFRAMCNNWILNSLQYRCWTTEAAANLLFYWLSFFCLFCHLSHCLCLCLWFWLSLSISIVYINLSICPSIYASVSLGASIHRLSNPSICFIYVPIAGSLYLHDRVYLLISPSTHLYVWYFFKFHI